jgi:thiol-disulfide isomerase/thioredoxin
MTTDHQGLLARHADRRRWLTDAAALAAGVCACAAGGIGSSVLAQTGTAVAWPAIDLLDGTRLDPSTWQDTAAVIVFWATHCPFCRRHNAHVEKLHRAVAGRPLRVIGAALDRDPGVVRAYLRTHGYTFPVTMQGESLRRLFSPRTVMPLTVTVDRRGRVATPIPGEMFEEDVLALARLADPPR